MRHYVFGYGSLICSESRAVTAKALGGSSGSGDAIPVRLKNWVRLWNVRGNNTYLGVESCGFADKSIKSEPKTTSKQQPSCVGVLVPLPSSNDDDYDEALNALDRREYAYTRQRVHLGSIERVDDLLMVEAEGSSGTKDDVESTKSTSDSGTTDLRKKQMDYDDFLQRHLSREETARRARWAREDQVKGMATSEQPILQSYVDVCMKGCLLISEAFAREFVEGTYGWYPGHSHTSSCGSSSKDEKEGAMGDSSFCWVNDRTNPIYVRADKDYSLEHSEALDAVFDPSLLRRRR